MFPLGSVLFPGIVLPLHVFEPRYRRLTADCLEGDGLLGIVLIERGSEVGGGDARFPIGTEARVLASSALPDGRWLLLVSGERRIRVERWVAEEPYPRAEVTVVDDAATTEDLGPVRDAVEAQLVRAHSLLAELGELPPGQAGAELATDPALACWQAAAAAPLGPADRQSVLATDGVGARLRLLSALLAEQIDVLALRASGG